MNQLFNTPNQQQQPPPSQQQQQQQQQQQNQQFKQQHVQQQTNVEQPFVQNTERVGVVDRAAELTQPTSTTARDASHATDDDESNTIANEIAAKMNALLDKPHIANVAALPVDLKQQIRYVCACMCVIVSLLCPRACVSMCVGRRRRVRRRD